MYQILCLLFLLLISPLSSSTPSPQPTQSLNTLAAQQAFQLGLFSIAESLSQEIIASNPPPESLSQIYPTYLFSLLYQSKFQLLSSTLPTTSSYLEKNLSLFLDALIPFYQNAFKTASQKLQPIQPSLLPKEHLFEFFLAYGICEFKLKRPSLALLHFKSASALPSLSPNQQNLLQFWSFLANTALTPPTEDSLKSLEKQLKSSKSPSLELISQYAYSLHLLNQSPKAIPFLESHIKRLQFSPHSNYESLVFLLALLPNSSDHAPKFLKDILKSKFSSQDNLAIALNLLLKYIESLPSHDAKLSSLNELLNLASHNPSLYESILLARALNRIAASQFPAAESDADSLLKSPSNSAKNNALLLKTIIALNQSPPHYNLAIDLLVQFQSTIDNKPQKDHIQSLIADTFFLNQDFPQAAPLYKSLYQDPTCDSYLKDTAFYQFILCLLNSNKLDDAILALQQSLSPSTPPSSLALQALWNTLLLSKSTHSPEQTLDLTDYALSLLQSSPPSPIKFQLLSLKISLLNDLQKPSLALNTLSSLKSLPTPPSLPQEFYPNILLSEAQSYLLLNQPSQAEPIISDLQKNYPNSNPAIYSYILFARYLASINKSAEAQQYLVKLSDSYPQNDLAVIALYESALNTESRALPNNYQEALSLLERIILSYPSHPLVLHAKLKQADILKKMGNFNDALAIYDDLLKQFPSHPFSPKFELNRADCLSALASDNPQKIKETASSYERLSDLPSLPIEIRIEAGFKNAYALQRANLTEKAQAAYWLTLQQFLLTPTSSDPLPNQSLYWLSRSALELAQSLENQSKFSEAQKIYQIILHYNLPGHNYIASKLTTLSNN